MQLMSATETHSVGQPGRPPKIMVVDDDAKLRQALQLRLRANRYEVVIACDGYSALALAQKELPDLILLDLGLPAGDGFKVLHHLRDFPRLCLIPVIVLTAKDPEANEKRTLEAGAMCFFQKPADNEELLGMIRLCLAAASGVGGELSS